MSEGGKGGSGTLVSDDSKERHRIGSLKGLQTVIKNRKGKTYSEIYGDKAEEEKEKRNSSDASKGRIPWNKGLDKSDKRVQKYIDNNKHKSFIKTYVLITPNNFELIFNGKKEIEIYIKNINSTLNKKSKINVDSLIKNKIDKNYKIKLQ